MLVSAGSIPIVFLRSAHYKVSIELKIQYFILLAQAYYLCHEYFAGLAQSLERLNRFQEVFGENPKSGSTPRFLGVELIPYRITVCELLARMRVVRHRHCTPRIECVTDPWDQRKYL